MLKSAGRRSVTTSYAIEINANFLFYSFQFSGKRFAVGWRFTFLTIASNLCSPDGRLGGSPAPPGPVIPHPDSICGVSPFKIEADVSSIEIDGIVAQLTRVFGDLPWPLPNFVLSALVSSILMNRKISSNLSHIVFWHIEAA